MSEKPKALTEEQSTDDDFEKALMSDEELEQEIAAYERKYGFSSEKLLEMQIEGKLADNYDFQDWLTLLQLRKK